MTILSIINFCFFFNLKLIFLSSPSDQIIILFKRCNSLLEFCKRSTLFKKIFILALLINIIHASLINYRTF